MLKVIPPYSGTEKYERYRESAMQQGPVLKICTISCQLILLVVGISACTSMLDYGSWNKPSSIQALRQLVKEGDVAAGTALGQKYEMGQGVRQDLKQAKNWYIKASKGGDPLAMFLLGQLLEFGLSDSPDYEQAAIYYAAAAELGHAEAQARLARFYEEGWGVPQSFEMANKWYSLEFNKEINFEKINSSTLLFLYLNLSCFFTLVGHESSSGIRKYLRLPPCLWPQPLEWPNPSAI